MPPLAAVYKLSYNYDDMAADELQKSLKELGLTGHEPAIYAALLRQSPAGAAWIARECGLSRSSVYTTLSALQAKGLVGTTHENEVKQFVAGGQEALVELLRRDRALAEERIARAQALPLARLVGAQIPQIVHFEGQQGLKRIYLDMLRAAPVGSTISILRDEFIWRPEWAFVFEDDWHQRVRRLRVEKNLRTRLLVNRSPVERRHAAYYKSRAGLERRYLKKPVRDFGLYLAGDTAAILSLPSHNLIGLRIINRDLSGNLQQVFDALWD
jgi:DNA-binding MarR family transcriptional regulator